MLTARRLTSCFAVALATAAVAAPAAMARPEYLGSPQAQDQPSPGALDAGATAVSSRSLIPKAGSQSQDLRSPDARDAARGTEIGTAPSIKIVRVGASGGFDWGDAGIGAGTLGGLLLVALGGGLLVAHRRQQRVTPRGPSALAG